MISPTQLARALTVLAEALVAERRVIVVGDSSLGLQELAADLGARIVHVYDPKIDAPVKGARIFPLPDGDFDVRDGAFDLAIVPDLTEVPDAAAVLARLRRVVGEEGAVMCAAANKDSEDGPAHDGGLDYYELFDLVSLQFESVRMIAAMPFVGVTLAELGQDEVESAVRVDTQLAGDRSPPNAFVALASQIDVALDAYAVIELEAPAKSRTAAAPDASRVTELEAALAQARLRATYLEAQVDELAQAKAARSRADEESRRALEALENERGRATRLEHEIDALRRAVTEAPPPPAEDFTDLAEQLAQAQIRASALEEGVELAEKTILVQRDRIAELESALTKAEEQAPPPPSVSVSAEEEIAVLEAKLEERGRRVAELEAEVSRREKLVKELVARIEGAPATLDDDLQKKLDELALLAARQQSELEARAWKIEELSRTAQS
jgi:hypothetical protein